MLPFILRFYDVAISGRVLISELTDMLYFDVTGFMTAEVLELQQKFEEDKKRIAKMKAARKFRPF
jgi:ribosomal RNA-processing protein 7